MGFAIDALTEGVNGCIEQYHNKKEEKKENLTTNWAKIIVFLIIILLVAFFGKLLWNEFLAGADKGVGYFTFIKPLPTLFHAIGVYVTLVLFFGSC